MPNPPLIVLLLRRVRSGSNQFGRELGRTIRSGTVFVTVRLNEDAGPDVDGNGVSDLADWIIGPPPVVDDGGNGS